MSENVTIISIINCTKSECVFVGHFGRDFKKGIGVAVCLLCTHSKED